VSTQTSSNLVATEVPYDNIQIWPDMHQDTVFHRKINIYPSLIDTLFFLT